MFNPKSNNLLDEQLAVSGLGMAIDPGTAILAGSAISAGTQIIGGIFGSRSASKKNAAARRAQAEQERYQKKVAKKTNKYNQEKFQMEQRNYAAQYQYAYETAVRDQKYRDTLQDYQYLSTLQQYQKSLAIGNQNLDLIAEDYIKAIDSQKAAIDEAFIQQEYQKKAAFDDLRETFIERNLDRQEQLVKLQGIQERKDFGRLGFKNTVDQLMSSNRVGQETALVESLIAQGTAQVSGQSGRITLKTKQANTAALQRGLMALRSEFSGKYRNAAVQLSQLNAQANLETVGVGLNLERIDNALQRARDEAETNLDVLQSNMQSTIAQAERNIEEIGLKRRVAELNLKERMPLFPQRPLRAPRYEPPPYAEMIEPMKAIPGYTPPAQQVSTSAPIINGLISAAGTMATGAFNASPYMTNSAQKSPGTLPVSGGTTPLDTSKLTNPASYLNNSPSNFTGGYQFPFP